VAIKVLKKITMKGKERKNLLEMEIEVMYAVKNMIKKDIKAG
jgi:hypothetical protein